MSGLKAFNLQGWIKDHELLLKPAVNNSMIWEDGEHKRLDIKEGEVLPPPHKHHSPQPPEAGSIGLVVEPKHPAGAKDALEWCCIECGDKVRRVEFILDSIIEDLPPAYESFYSDHEVHTCGRGGARHPGKKAVSA